MMEGDTDMSRKAMTFAAAHAVSHSARSSKAASFALIEAVRFFAYRFFYYYFYGSADLSPAQGASGKAAMA